MTAALNRFISRSTERCKSFFQLLHKWKDFSSFKECDKAFNELKAYLVYPPVLSRLEKKEVLYAYVVVARHVVSLVLIRVHEGIQKQVSPLGEGNSCYHPCHQEATPQLPSPHHDCPNSVALISIVSKIRLYRKSGKIGNYAQCI